MDRPSGFGPLPFDGISEASVGRHAFSDDGCFLVITSNNDVLSTLDDDPGPTSSASTAAWRAIRPSSSA